MGLERGAHLRGVSGEPLRKLIRAQAAAIFDALARIESEAERPTATRIPPQTPAPPAPGVIGSRELLKPRSIIDSAAGVVWVVHVLGGVEQEFIDGGYRDDYYNITQDELDINDTHFRGPYGEIGLQYYAGRMLIHVGMGAKAPILIDSRTATAREKLHSIALAKLMCRTVQGGSEVSDEG